MSDNHGGARPGSGRPRVRLVDLVVEGRFDANNRAHRRALLDDELPDEPRFAVLRVLAARYKLVVGWRAEAAPVAQAFELIVRRGEW